MFMRRIALIFTWNLSYCRAVLRGVRRFASSHPEWTLELIGPHSPVLCELLRRKPDGIIAHICSPKLDEWLAQLDLPTVNVSGVLPTTRFPRVGIDDEAVGMMTGDHFLKNGLRHFAFVGHAGHQYSQKRERGFADFLSTHGFSPMNWEYKGKSDFDAQGRVWASNANLRRWLSKLPRPVGVFACNDLWAVQISEACRCIGLDVPKDIAIVGVDDDDLLCDLSRPSLSSVATPGETIGTQAARLLENLMSERPGYGAHSACSDSVPEPILIPPKYLAVRQSSDLIASDDPIVSEVIRMIRSSHVPDLRVRDILDSLAVGRRSLERRFRKQIGHGIWQEIRNQKIEKARRLLAETTLSMSKVARMSGFSSSKQLSTVFRQVLKLTPTAYRKQYD
ncbi:MAG: XylR family transcriptional regulator [Phycisphaerae bacterium]|nr:MAG: XylR family transcriptional regulator [Phycisphaerae bacterium]